MAGTVTITPLADGTPAGPPIVAAIADGLGSFIVDPLLNGGVVACQPRGSSGVLFGCETIHCDYPSSYGFQSKCPFGPKAPPGALARVHKPNFMGDVDVADCDTITCSSTWCTLGDPCGGDGNTCLA